jgi:bacillithiol system protein YtxJ
MKWTELKSLQQLEDLRKESEETPVLIFKHSTRCATSRMSLDRLERGWTQGEKDGIRPYFLDLINYRDVSNTIAETFNVQHESPQVLVIHKGESILDLSHYDINYEEIRKALRN